MDPGASGPNGDAGNRDQVGSGAERQRYRAAPIGRESDPSVTECGIAE
jgi:hypothetical protein